MRIQAGPREWGRGRWRLREGYLQWGGGGCHPPKVFVSFLLEDKTSAPDVFSSCSFIPGAHFESSSVSVSMVKRYDVISRRWSSNF